MAVGTGKLYASNSYTVYDKTIIGSNSYAAVVGDFIKNVTGTGVKAAAGDTILGVSATGKTFDSDNVTIAKAPLFYLPTNLDRTYLIPIAGETLTFSAALVTSNTINLKVNGVAMTQITFATDNATTLAAIATQLVTDFPTVIAAAAATTSRIIAITPVGVNSSVVITNVVVAAGASQATGTVANVVAVTSDEQSYFDLTTGGQMINYATKSASSGQMQLQHIIGDGSIGEFSIANT